MLRVLRGCPLLSAALLLIAVFQVGGCRAQEEIEDLNGLEIRCCVLIERPHVFTTASDGFTGLAVKYLRELERQLNFKCVSLFEYEGEGKYAGFSGLTQYFNDCAESGDSSTCNCDMAVSGFAETRDRLPKVDFPAAYAFDSYAVVQRLDGFKNANADNVPLLFAPFTLPVWIGVISIMFTHTLVTLFDMEFLPEQDGKFETGGLSTFESIRYAMLKTWPLRKFRYAVFNSLYAMMGTEAPQVVRTLRRRSAPTRQRVLGLIAQFSGLFLILCYEAGLVVQLFADEPVATFRSIDDVKNCRIDAKDFCVPRGGAAEDYWKLAVEAARDTCRREGISIEEDQPTFVGGEGSLKDPYSIGLNNVAQKNDCTYFMALSSTLTVAAEN